MSIKYADDIIKEIEERGQIQVPEGCVTGEEFEKWLRENKVDFTKEEIEYCKDILNELDKEN